MYPTIKQSTGKKKQQQAYGQRLLLQVNRSVKTKVVPVQCMEDSDGC